MKPLIETKKDWPIIGVVLLYRTDRCEFWRIDFEGKWPEYVTDWKGDTVTVTLYGCDCTGTKRGDSSAVTFFGVPPGSEVLVTRDKRQFLIAFLKPVS